MPQFRVYMKSLDILLIFKGLKVYHQTQPIAINLIVPVLINWSGLILFLNQIGANRIGFK